MAAERGTRPTGPRRWPRTQEQRRLEAEQIGQEIVRLAQEARRTANIYDHRAILFEIETQGERLQRLMVQAQLGEE